MFAILRQSAANTSKILLAFSSQQKTPIHRKQLVGTFSHSIDFYYCYSSPTCTHASSLGGTNFLYCSFRLYGTYFKPTLLSQSFFFFIILLVFFLLLLKPHSSRCWLLTLAPPAVIAFPTKRHCHQTAPLALQK